MLRRQIFSIVAITGLFLQLLIMGLHIPSSIALAGLAGTTVSAQGVYRSITICTANGLRTISIDENNQPVERDNPVNLDGIGCPICQSFSSQTLLVEPVALPVRAAVLSRACRFAKFAQQDHFRPLSCLARAPPRS